ncbi:MAG TPA: NAD(P)/FAD-dependent oxidoreductase [Solirubrobacterales bacterium]|nr:NAD(P)/FAD-dependent oxidoreductase [Solirubrobacterales bacterium]
MLGAGPAGLTAAYVLARAGRPVVVFEAEGTVGGIARTEIRDGYRFDLGGHRFFTKSAEVSRLWREVLGDELILRPRLSRIYWRGRFIDYPLRAADVVGKVGAVELVRCLASYLAAMPRRARRAETFEEWVTARFGRRLFEHFFKSYTEKVWGVPTSEIRAEWAAQRIRGLSFLQAARSALPGRLGGPGEVRSLIDEFLYPRLGPGQMWETMADEVIAAGGELRLRSAVEAIELDGRGALAAVHAGGERVVAAAAISSLPLPTMVRITTPAPPRPVAAAAAGLRYRDFMTVALIVDGEEPFPDNWIYVHDPRVRVGRIQNFRAWSEEMVPGPGRTCLGLEYFCFVDDRLWSTPDAELIALATRELDQLGLVAAGRVRGGHVVRVPRAYPIYDSGYAERVGAVRAWLETVPGLQQVGRNGLHRYNNSDHSMLTALRAVENLDGAGHDIWSVNVESAYHEQGKAAELEPVELEQPYRSPPEPGPEPEPAAPALGAAQPTAMLDLLPLMAGAAQLLP